MSFPNTTYQFKPGVIDATFTPDQLIAGNFKLVTDTISVAQGQQLVRGAVIGRRTKTGEWVLSVSTATDGSEIPAAVLADNVDASQSTTSVLVYLSGEFNSHYMGIDSSWDLEAIKHALRASNIHVKTSLSNALI